jgi:hypothetical protein
MERSGGHAVRRRKEERTALEDAEAARLPEAVRAPLVAVLRDGTRVYDEDRRSVRRRASRVAEPGRRKRRTPR